MHEIFGFLDWGGEYAFDVPILVKVDFRSKIALEYAVKDEGVFYWPTVCSVQGVIGTERYLRPGIKIDYEKHKNINLQPIESLYCVLDVHQEMKILQPFCLKMTSEKLSVLNFLFLIYFTKIKNVCLISKI